MKLNVTNTYNCWDTSMAAGKLAIKGCYGELDPSAHLDFIYQTIFQFYFSYTF